MAPRPYRSDKRQATAEQTRARIVAAAGDLLAAGDNPRGFSMDAVAHEADVARMTVYHQFQSRRGLFEALADDMAGRAQLGPRAGAALALPDPVAALEAYVAAFAHFWTVNRALVRRTHAVAELDPEIGRGNAERNQRRRDAVRGLLERLSAEHGRPSPDGLDQAVDVVHMLTGFASFDGLAGPTRTPADVTALVLDLIRPALGLPGGRTSNS